MATSSFKLFQQLHDLALNKTRIHLASCNRSIRSPQILVDSYVLFKVSNRPDFTSYHPVRSSILSSNTGWRRLGIKVRCLGNYFEPWNLFLFSFDSLCMYCINKIFFYKQDVNSASSFKAKLYTRIEAKYLTIP